MAIDRRKRRRPSVLEDLGLLDRSIVVDAERFTSLLEGLLDLRGTVPVTPSLVLARPSPEAAALPELVSALLMVNLRSLDVISWLEPETIAILLDADATDAMQIALRLQSLLGRSFRSRPSWIGVTTASGSETTSDAMLAAASDALSVALRCPSGAIEITPS